MNGGFFVDIFIVAEVSMGILNRLSGIYENSLAAFENGGAGSGFSTLMLLGGAREDCRNRLILGDNLELLKKLRSEGGSVDFIYIDPPFFSGADYDARVNVAGSGIKNKAYGDRWKDGLEGFLSMLTLRLLYMKNILSEKGCIAVHLDRRAVHYAKLMLDEIFGEERMVNELIWTYKSGGSGRRSFSHKHDTILVYSKSENYVFNPQKEVSYNRQGRPYNFKGVKEYQDERGNWYTLVNRKDVIAVDMVGRTSSERTGYATQKPEALLKILVESFTDEGALCADFFCGSGSLGAAAHSLGRSFLCCDSGPQAVEISCRRLALAGAEFALDKTKESSFRKAELRAEIEHIKLSETSENGPCQKKCDAKNEIKECEKNSPKDFASEPCIKSKIAESGAKTREESASIRLISYKIPVAALELDAKQQKKLKEKSRADRLALVDFWAVDENYDGRVFRASKLIFEGDRMKLDNCGQNVAVAAFDAFGGCAFSALDSI